ncbi:MAG: helix-turn-helix transcriptional regulator [Clostridia bacterium]|nr:helix-turn-helix transcriptional regulator [Clostridia bacterium]
MSSEDLKEITNKYGENIKAVRKKLKLSQEEISTQIGITYRAYSSYERGDRNPSLEFMAALNKMYNVNLNYVITGEGEMFNAPKFEDVQDEITLKVESILKAKGLI